MIKKQGRSDGWDLHNALELIESALAGRVGIKWRVEGQTRVRSVATALLYSVVRIIWDMQTMQRTSASARATRSSRSFQTSIISDHEVQER